MMAMHHADELRRRWLRLGAVVVSFAVGSAGSGAGAVCLLKAASSHYLLRYVTIVDAVEIVGIVAGLLTACFGLAAIGTGALARGSRPSVLSAGLLGCAAAIVAAGTILYGVPMLGLIVAPLVAGMLVGRAGWSRAHNRATTAS